MTVCTEDTPETVPKVLSVSTVGLNHKFVGVLRFKINFRLTNLTIFLQCLVLQLSKVKNVYDEVELFKFLSEFGPHIMAPLILQPNHSKRPEPVFGLKTVSCSDKIYQFRNSSLYWFNFINFIYLHGRVQTSISFHKNL